jgi:hypothetical protein
MRTQKSKTKTVETQKHTTKSSAVNMNLEEATTFLKKIGEWESAWRMERDTIIKWANFLKEREKV